MKILGISAFYHDAAAAITVNGKVLAAAQEERFTRIKHDPDFPVNAIKYCLEETGLAINELDAVVFYDKPLLKFERLLETYYAFAPKGLISFLKAIPVWIREKMFLKKQIYEGLKEVENYDKKQLKLLFSEHHLSHAASVFYASPYENAAILTIDGVGEWATTAIGTGKGNQITFQKELHFPHSIGLLYSAFTYFLGFKVNSGEYKLMGLAPYGNLKDAQTQDFIKKIKATLVSIKEDGSIWLNQTYFGYATGLRMIKEKKWEQLFGLTKRSIDSTDIQQDYCNLALAIQQVTEEIVLKMAQEVKKITGLDNLCLAGGVALNCVANGKLLRANIFKNIYIQPAAGDAGGALGAALAVHFMHFQNERSILKEEDFMKGSYLGPAFSKKEVILMNRKVKAVAREFDTFNEVTKRVADKLAAGKVIGWFQGRMEFGPRALGNRSILGNPQNPAMQKKLNLKIKYREGFRPFAPSVLQEDAADYFDMDVNSPYMLLVAQVHKDKKLALPSNYDSLAIWEKLYHPRSEVQAITHVDGSARIQTVDKKLNPEYWQLINAFKEKTGCSLLVNTSFNVRGEPIVCTPLDAYTCFMSTEMDYLVINNFLYKKEAQPDYQNKEKWRQQFKLD